MTASQQSAETPLRRLTEAQVEQYQRCGYIKNLSVIDASEISTLQASFEKLAARLPDGTDINQVNMWHKCSRTFYDLSRHPAILDYVEDLIGPDFFQWAGQFFVKYPGDGSEVPWHQDAQYWPLSPQQTVSVWLAVYDTDTNNAAMQVVSGSHRRGQFVHHTNNNPHLVLDQEADISNCQPEDIVTIDLKAGEISLHDSGLLHGSGPNQSQRMRCGMTMRFAPTCVQADLSQWPTFEAYMARGIDRLHLNPHGPVPTGEEFPVRKFQHSSEFRYN